MHQNSPWLPLGALLVAVLGAAGLLATFQARHASLEAPTGQAVPVVDGVLNEREYAQSYEDTTTGLTLAWTVVGDEILLGLSGPTEGWLSFGLDPSGSLMAEADIWIAYVQDGNVVVQDGFSKQPGTHEADTALGGQASFLQTAGAENERGTTIELRRKLDTGDPFDKPVGPGKHTVLLARSDADDLVSYHAQRTALQLDLLSVATDAAEPSFWIFPSHLEAYDVWEIAWIFVLALFGVQGLISVFLEGQKLHPGPEKTPAESGMAVLWMLLLLAGEVFISVRFIFDLPEAPVQTLAVEASAGFFVLAAMALVYRRSFLPEEAALHEREDHVPW
jgi:hypothetical protein